MNLPAHNLHSAQLQLRVVVGPEPGQVYEFTGVPLTIGRAPDNDIIFSQDPKISRNHAAIEMRGSSVFIKNISERNFIIVNEKKCNESELLNGSKIQIGEVEFLVELPDTLNEVIHSQINNQWNNDSNPTDQWSLPQNQEVADSHQESHLNAIDPNMSWQDPNQYTETNSATQKNKPNGRVRFYGIIAVFGFLFWYLMSSNNVTKEDALKIRTSEEILKETEATRERQKAIELARNKQGTNTRQFDEAQSSYIRCFRDYRQGQYTRAMQHCQAALSLYPQHELAERYLRLSTRKRDENIQYLLRKGRQHRDRGHYKMCKSALKTVMYEIRDPKNIIFKEAREMYSECHSLGEGRY